MREIRRYVFPYIDSNMYIVSEGSQALVVDPHESEEAYGDLQRQGVETATVLLTHEHFDHTSGIGWFRERFDTTLVCQINALDQRSQRIFNRPVVISLHLAGEKSDKKAKKLSREFPPYTYTAETTFEESCDLEWSGYHIHMERLPGHSPASCLILLDQHICFTGDSLIPELPITLRWPRSDRNAYETLSVPKLENLPADVMLYPGHGETVRRGEVAYQKQTCTWKLVRGGV